MQFQSSVALSGCRYVAQNIKKLLGWVALTVAAVTVVAAVAAVALHGGSPGGGADEGRVVEAHTIVCPFGANYELTPRYEYVERGGVPWLSVTTDSMREEPWNSLVFSDSQVDVGNQIFYRLTVHTGTTTLIRETTWSPRDEVKWFRLDNKLGERISSMTFRLSLFMLHDGNTLCNEERNTVDDDLPDWLLTKLAEEPDPTPSPTPTQVPVCHYAATQDALDAMAPTAKAWQDGEGNWQVTVRWSPYVDGATRARHYRVRSPRLVADAQLKSGLEFLQVTVGWEGGTDANQVYTLDLEVWGGTLAYKSDGCKWGTKQVEFKLGSDDDDCKEVVPSLAASDVSITGRRMTGDYGSGWVAPSVSFNHVGAESYLVVLGGVRTVVVTPGDDVSWGDDMRLSDSRLVNDRQFFFYSVTITPSVGACLGVPLTVRCFGRCPLLGMGENPPEVPQGDPPETATPTPTPVPAGQPNQPVTQPEDTPETGCETHTADLLLSASTSRNGAGDHEVTVTLTNPQNVAIYQVATSYDGGTPVIMEVSEAELAAGKMIGAFAGPVNSGEYFVLGVQARVWTGTCGGAWGPVTIVDLQGGEESATPTPVPTNTPTPTPPGMRGAGPTFDKPVGWRVWEGTPNAGQQPGHYAWCYSGEFDGRLDDYYARVKSFADSYEAQLLAEGSPRPNARVDEAVEEVFERPQELCSRLGLFGLVRLGLAWLGGVVAALAMASGLVVLLVKSTAGDSPQTQVWARNAFIGLALVTVLVGIVWVIFEVVVGAAFGVGPENLSDVDLSQLSASIRLPMPCGS